MIIPYYYYLLNLYLMLLNQYQYSKDYTLLLQEHFLILTNYLLLNHYLVLILHLTIRLIIP
jgi:hypothetical protein